MPKTISLFAALPVAPNMPRNRVDKGGVSCHSLPKSEVFVIVNT